MLLFIAHFNMIHSQLYLLRISEKNRMTRATPTLSISGLCIHSTFEILLILGQWGEEFSIDSLNTFQENKCVCATCPVFKAGYWFSLTHLLEGGCIAYPILQWQGKKYVFPPTLPMMHQNLLWATEQVTTRFEGVQNTLLQSEQKQV